MKDVDQTDGDNPYECFSCGNIVRTDSQPLSCPDCCGEMRNRLTTLE
ncbi:MAG: rubrerythrin-like domain-containing protein [Halolamina sp.]